MLFTALAALFLGQERHHIDLRYNVGADGNYRLADAQIPPPIRIVTSSTVLGRPGARDSTAHTMYDTNHPPHRHQGDRESLLAPQQVQTSYKQDTTRADNTVDGDVTTSWSSSFLNHGHYPAHSLQTRASLNNPDKSQWILYDLGVFRSIRALRIHVSGRDNTPYDMQLQVSTTQQYISGQLANLLAATPREQAWLGLPATGIANASRETGRHIAQHAFDGNPKTVWTSCWLDCYRGGKNRNVGNGETPGYGDDFPVTLDFRFDGDRQWRVTTYEIMQRMRDPTHTLHADSEFNKRAPRSWQFEGSNDGWNWDVLDLRQAQTFEPGVAKKYSIPNQPKSYNRYRLNITENAWDDQTETPQYHRKAAVTIAEVRLLSPEVQAVSNDFREVLAFRLHKRPGWQAFGGFQASGRYFKLKALNNYGYRSGRVGSSTRINELELLS